MTRDELIKELIELDAAFVTFFESVGDGRPCNVINEAIAALRAASWQPIETAPRDGTEIWIYAPAYQGLSAIQCGCAYHPDAGFCVDELREPTHWMPLPEPPA